MSTLALLKAGVEKTDPIVARGITEIVANCGRPYTADSHHYYTAGIEMMALETAAGAEYRDQVQSLATYMMSGQMDNGGWYYPHGSTDELKGRYGDTSISQYAALGLWSAERVGIDIPNKVWNGLVSWHFKTQWEDGGFSYHPPLSAEPTDRMTIAAVGTLMIARAHLHPDATGFGPKKPKKKTRKFGFLEAVDINEEEQSTPAGGRLEEKPINLRQIDVSVLRGLSWIDRRFFVPSSEWPFYHLYTLERSATLTERDSIGGKDWYRVGTGYLKQVGSGGSWSPGKVAGNHSIVTPVTSTSLALLFLSRSTAQAVGKIPGAETFGGGLLAGGRGLPDKLSDVNVINGEVVVKKVDGSLSELLSALDRGGVTDLTQLQTAVITNVRDGDREALQNQYEMLEKLSQHARPDVRKIALWSVARSGDLSKSSKILLRGLKDDDVGVMIEAHNGLCFLSRKFDGYGLGSDPLENATSTMSRQERQNVIREWQQAAVKNWSGWFEHVASYDDQFLSDLD
ncbi:hypothetical protein [Calycomorphotria hydatis]|uniref:hypothetical protein n=1 Tax=Calycomorphotria hydatis TaxID=2528027 RepID=UPI0011A5DB93|nr:hypothetical protein [Calycomorphotria hydatis]